MPSAEGRAAGGARCIALVGLPGVGKTTVGRLVANVLGRTFFDCDGAFEAEFGSDIGDWVVAHGWPAFRIHERRILAAALTLENCVIATGGGVVEDARNRAALSALSTVVWLTAPLAVLHARLAQSHERPLLAADPDRRLVELAARRAPLYREISHLEVAVSTEPPSFVAERIMGALNLQVAPS